MIEDPVSILKQGARVWNQWIADYRRDPQDPLLAEYSNRPCLDAVDLRGATLSGVDLSFMYLRRARLVDANLEGAALQGTDFSLADMRSSALQNSDLTSAKLIFTNLSKSNLTAARLKSAEMRRANLAGAVLREADLSGALLNETVFANSDLSGVKGLESVCHERPSFLDFRTFVISGGLPPIFLKGCGFPDQLIAHLPSLLAHEDHFYSCFISYSHSDRIFARRLHDALQERGVRCWLDEKQLLPGHDIYEEIDRGIRSWDKVVLCCSEASLTSWWVDAEIAKAFAKEQELSRERGGVIRAVIPLDLDGYLLSRKWKSGKASCILERFVANFNGWQDDDELFSRHLEDLVQVLRCDDGSRETPPTSRL